MTGESVVPASIRFAGVLLFVVLFCHAWLCCSALSLPRSWTSAARSVGSVLLLGGASLATFLVYLSGPRLGLVWAYVVMAAPFVGAAVVSYRRRDGWAALCTFHTRLLPALCLSVAILWVGLYPFAWDGNDWTVPAHRWRALTVDNWLSLFFADMLVAGEIRRPMLAEWQSSDRPPLQVGTFLIFRPLMSSLPGLVYQASSTWAQTLLLLPLSLLLTHTKRHAHALTLLMLGLSPLVFLNGLFVWPKLFAGAFCAIFHLSLFADADEERLRRDVFTGAAAGFALLSHGGAAFALFGSSLAFLVLPSPLARPSASDGRAPEAAPKRTRLDYWHATLRLLRVAPVTATLLVPWILYQRFVDPPGDRLIKWHFAGQIPVTNIPFLPTLRHAYATISFSDLVSARVVNLQTILAGTLSFFADLWTLLTSPTGDASMQTLHEMIEGTFHFPAYNAWFFGPVLLALLLGYAILKKQPLAALWPAGVPLATGLGLLVWLLLTFLPGAAIVHAGGYFTIVCMPLVVMLAAAQLTPRLFRGLALAQLAVFLALYVFDRPFATLARPWLYLLGSPLLLASYWAACQRAAAIDSGPLR